MNNPSYIWIGLLLILVSARSMAAGLQYFVVPLGGLSGLSQPFIPHNAVAGLKYGAMIDEKYADLVFTADAQQQLNSHFKQIVSQAYPGAVIGTNQVIGQGKTGSYIYDPDDYPCSKKFQVGYQKVFVASLGISRLSAYINDFGDQTQILLPVTYTLRLIKMNGASVTYSKSETVYTIYEAGRSEFYDRSSTEISPKVLAHLKSLVLKDGMDSVKRILEVAVKNFAPKQSQVTLIGKNGPYFLFDRGSEVGFKSGKAFAASAPGNESEYLFDIKYATERTAVAVASKTGSGAPSPKSLSTGTKLEFDIDSQGVDDAKILLLASQYTPNVKKLSQEQLMSNALMSLLVDDLGFGLPFNVIKHDPDFQRLKQQIRGEINCESKMYEELPGFAEASTIQRADPDLILKLDHYSSPTMTVAGVGGVTVNTILENAVSLSLMDLTGVIRQNFLGNRNYVLSRTDGKGLLPEQAKEVNLKNAGLIAAKELVQKLNPKKRVVKVVLAKDGMASLDSQISPAGFKQFRLYRPIEFNTKTVLIPILSRDQDSVAFDQPSEATEKIGYRGNLKVGDVLVQNYSDDGFNPIKLCQRQTTFLQSPQLTAPSGLVMALRYAVGADLKSYDLVEDNPDFIRSVDEALIGGFFSTRKLGVQSATSRCLVPIEFQQATKVSCTAGKCSGNVNVASGFRIYDKDSKIDESIVPSAMEFKDVPEKEVAGFIGLKSYEQHLKSLAIHKSKIK